MPWGIGILDCATNWWTISISWDCVSDITFLFNSINSKKMRNLYKSVGVFLFGIALTFNVACSKDDDGPGDQLGRVGTLSMKIDGKLWEADIATIMTVGDQEVEDGEDVAYWVNMSGVKVLNAGSDEAAESISLSLL